MADAAPAGGARLPERLTLEVAGATLTALQKQLADEPGPEVLVDASQLQDCDSSAVAVLLEVRRTLAAQGKSLQINNWPERLQALVTLYGVSELLPA